MSSIDSLAKDLYTIIHNKEEKGPKPYEPVAEVVKVDADTIWVKIPGGENETPVEKTIDAEIGDRVRLRVSGGRAWMLGNATSPPASSEATVRYIQDGLEYNASFAENFSNSIVQNSTIVNSAVENAIIQNSEMVESRIYNSDIENFTVIDGVVQDLEATDAIIQGHLEAHDAEFESLDTNYAHITNGVIDNATIGYADIDDLNAHYAEIDLANVNNAWIEYGAMKKAEVFDENVFDLSGDHATISKIDASRINVANLNADNLIVRRINGQPVVGGYTLISPSSSGYSSKNPRALGWYEFVNAQWVLSQDTTVDMTKAYYQTGNEVSLYDQAYIDGLEHDLQQQIDGAVETFTGSVVPTLVNWPYTDWYDTSVTPVHDERAKHVGDIYYVVNSASDENGYCYRFAYDNTTHAYSWVLIKDSDVTKALSDISDLQTFESNTTSWIEETDEGLETIRTNYTALSGTVDKTVKESIQLWFTKANTTAPNKPNSTTYPNGVTDTSTAGNGWRVVVPAWDASYPNYFYCWQYKFVDGTFGWSNVVRDIAMGETQGTARDAKNTADNALPASTFTSFESTTFKDVKDTVNEQSTKFTNMTTRLGLNSDGTGANTDIVAKESALEQTVDGISTRVGKTETKLIGMYATSSTAANARAKAATIVPTLPNDAVWELTSGTMVTVKFVNANTYAATATYPLTLNINSKGAKPIKTYSNGDLSEAEYKWAAGSTFTFVYNGTNWLMQDSTQSVRMNSNETKINQTATSIESLASNQTTYTKPDGTTGTNAIKSAITQTANSIESVVANNATYTAPDGTTKTNTIQSAIKQNADNILLRVEKSGVIAAINASVEEQGGSAVKISADKVNIEGAAIFTGSGRLSQTSLDNTYDALGAAAVVEAQIPTDISELNDSQHLIPDISGKADKTAAIAEEQRIYYRSNSSTKPNGNGLPTTWVTETGNKYNTNATTSTGWSRKVTPIANGTGSSVTKYLYLWTCIQKKTVSGTVTYGDILLDDSTTVIDGGKIVTGSVSANAVSATSGTFDTANIPNLNASKITTGDISADRMKVNSISAINENTGTVKISANKVNITGTAVFDAVNNDASASAAMLNSNIEIGGRNLFKGTKVTATTSSVAAGKAAVGIEDGKQITVSVRVDADNVVWASSGYTRIGTEFSITKTGGGTQYIGVWAGKELSEGANIVEAFAGSFHGRISKTFTLEGNISADAVTAYLYIQGVSSGTASVSNVKVELGNKATDWTPAPEDVQSEIDAKKSVHTLTSTNTTGASYQQILEWTAEGRANSAWTVSSVAGVKIGDTCRIAFKANDMGANGTIVYAVGEVTSITGNTVYMTMHGLDTTVIDGGHILTGSIDANKVNIQNLTVGSAQSGWNDVMNSNIDIGGRNIWRNTRDYSDHTISVQSGDAITIIDSDPTDIVNYPNVATGSVYQYISMKNRAPYAVVRNKAVTVSLLVKAENGVTTGCHVNLLYYQNKTGGSVQAGISLIDHEIHGTGEWEKITNTFYVDDSVWHIYSGATRPSSDAGYIRCALYKWYEEGTYTAGFQAKELKVEVGNKATDWSPAPEDVAATATSYITDIDDKTGITIKAVNGTTDNNATTGNYLKLNPTEGLNIYKGGVSVAQYGDTARVGTEEGAHITVSGTEISGQSSLGEYFSVDATGGVQPTDVIMGNIIVYSDSAAHSIDLTTYSGWTNVASDGTGKFKVSVKYAYGSIYRPSAVRTLSQTFVRGTPSSSSSIYITYDGVNTITITTLAPTTDYTLKQRTVTVYYEKASATPFYRFGNNVAESGGAYSFLMGEGTKSNLKNQLVVGQYNDDVSDGAFIVGNGSSDSSRGNAFSVDTYGGIKINGNTLADYVIERGRKRSSSIAASYADWNYEKWASGKVEAWGIEETGVLTMSKDTNLYRATNVSLSIPSGIFSYAPTFTQAYTEYTAAHTVSVSANATSATAISAQIWKDYNANAQVTIRFHCVYYPSNY